MGSKPENVAVYGGDHSPWVQAVLLALYDKNIFHSVATMPSPKLFIQSGILMPAVRFDGGGWEMESQEILCKLGYERLSDDDMLAIYRALRGGVHRIDSLRQFWWAWGSLRDLRLPLFFRLTNSFLRPFTVLYFYLGLKRLGKNEKTSPSPENLERQYLYWEEQLENSSGPFLDGDVPGARDFFLFGGIQCHTSIAVPAVLVLQSSPMLVRVREWISVMQKRFEGYEHLYSGQYFAPQMRGPESSGRCERLTFILGTIVFALVLPIAIQLARYFFRRVRRKRVKSLL